jgi:plastocyanin
MTRRRSISYLALAGLITASATGCGAAASGPASGSAPGASGGSAGGAPVERSLTAKGIAFEPGTMTIATGHPLIVAFDNLDPGTPHGLVLYADPGQTIKLAEAPILVGPERQRFEIPSLVPGRYRFSCVVHPMMEADLVVEPS